MTELRFSHPDPTHTGSEYIGVTVLEFVDGTATTDVAVPAGRVRQLEAAGYTVTSDPQGAPDGLDSLTVAELKAHADEHGIDLDGATKKADIVAAIETGQD
ncbi:hypothetical protein IEE94_11175 [Yimella sp. cx-573]|nr:hypothetical protein [Yimella sp. cx-573]